MQHKIPLALQQVLEPIVIENSWVARPIYDNQVLFKLVPINRELPFYYSIVNTEFKGSKLLCMVNYCPRHNNTNEVYEVHVELDVITNSIKSWINNLIEFNKISSFYEDPILRFNRENLEKEFIIKDDDANYNPYNFEQQIKIELFATELNKLLLEYKDNFPDKNDIEINEIIQDVNELTNNITRETKSKIFSRITTIFAKIQKTNLSLFKATIKKFTFDFAIQLSVEVAVRALLK
jgi:hypothetical protein